MYSSNTTYVQKLISDTQDEGNGMERKGKNKLKQLNDWIKQCKCIRNKSKMQLYWGTQCNKTQRMTLSQGVSEAENLCQIYAPFV